MTTLTLAHVSDLHLPFPLTLTARQHFSKRQLSYWSWMRRRQIQSPRVLEKLVAELRAARPDHIAMTGDIVNLSLPAEFAAATDWLRALAPPQRISLVPGNHDALVQVAPEQGVERWSAWTRLGVSGWPFVHELDGAVLIGVNTAVPTLPALASGEVGARQRERLERCLLANTGRCRILLMHHPPADHAVSRRKTLSDRRALRAVLARAGAELVLHGHARNARFDVVAGPKTAIPCISVPSSSALPNPRDEAARWHLLTLSRQRGAWRVEVAVRQWSVEDGGFAPAGRYRLSLPVNSAA